MLNRPTFQLGINGCSWNMKYKIKKMLDGFFTRRFSETKSLLQIRIQATQSGIYNNNPFGRNKKRDLFSVFFVWQKLSLLRNVTVRSFNPLNFFLNEILCFRFKLKRWKFGGIGNPVTVSLGLAVCSKKIRSKYCIKQRWISNNRYTNLRIEPQML